MATTHQNMHAGASIAARVSSVSSTPPPPPFRSMQTLRPFVLTPPPGCCGRDIVVHIMVTMAWRIVLQAKRAHAKRANLGK